MNTLLRKISILLLLSCFVSNVFAAKKQKVPAWMADVHAEYPFEDFIAQVGKGSTEQAAQNDAVSQIARFIESDVKTTTDSMLTMISEEDEVFKKSFVNVNTTVSSNVQLFQVQHSESYYDKKAKTYYVVAFINRDDAFEILKPKIDVPAKKIQNYCDEAEKEIDNLKKGLILNNAYNESAEFIEQYCMVSMINQKAAKKYNSIYKQVLDLPATLKSTFRNCPISVIVENDLNGSVAGKVIEIFNNSGFPVSKSAEYTVTVNVSFDIQELATGYSYYPSFEAVVEGSNGVAGSFGQKGKKISAKNSDVAQKRAYVEIENCIEEAFFAQFLVRK